MEIGLDFDGVISDCGKLKSDGAKELYGLDILPHKMKKEVLIAEGLMTADQYREVQKLVYGTRETGLRMDAVDGLLQHLSQLLSDGHRVRVITSRGRKELEIAQEWMTHQGIQLDCIGLGNGVSKAESAQGLDVYIDDDLDKLEPLIGIVPHLFLFSWGYNRHEKCGKGIIRVSSWRMFYEMVKALAEVA